MHGFVYVNDFGKTGDSIAYTQIAAITDNPPRDQADAGHDPSAGLSCLVAGQASAQDDAATSAVAPATDEERAYAD